MCSLCGILGGRGHWADSTTSPDVFAARSQQQTPTGERQQRVRILNRVLAPYALRVSHFSAGQLLLRSATGRSQLVSNLSELWLAVERLSGQALDPLDPTLLDALATERTAS